MATGAGNAKRSAPDDEEDEEWEDLRVPPRERSARSLSTDTSARNLSNFIPNYGLPFNSSGSRLSERTQKEWLYRSKTWRGLDRASWRPKKVLGLGGHAVCGLFEYKGDDENMPREIVVKQAGSPESSLKNESTLLRACLASGTDHVVKLYKAYHQDAGTGTSDQFDKLPITVEPNGAVIYRKSYEVSRIYIEYCENGDMKSFVKRWCTEQEVIPEEAIWRVWHCLAKGMMVMEHGSEDPNAQSWEKPMGHFDIKPENILVGPMDKGKHRKVHVFKFADLGLGMWIPASQNDRFKREVEWRATAAWITPEQLYRKHPNRKFGTAINIWATAACIYYLASSRNMFQRELFDATVRGSDIIYKSYGPDLIGSPYSKRLIDLIHQCLAYDPDERPGAKDILRITRQVIDKYDAMTGPNQIPSANILPTGMPGFDVDQDDMNPMIYSLSQVVEPSPTVWIPEDLEADVEPGPDLLFPMEPRNPPRDPNTYPWETFVDSPETRPSQATEEEAAAATPAEEGVGEGEENVEADEDEDKEGDEAEKPKDTKDDNQANNPGGNDPVNNPGTGAGDDAAGAVAPARPPRVWGAYSGLPIVCG